MDPALRAELDETGRHVGPEGLELLLIAAPNLGEAQREDVEGQRDWWADEQSRAEA